MRTSHPCGVFTTKTKNGLQPQYLNHLTSITRILFKLSSPCFFQSQTVVLA